MLRHPLGGTGNLLINNSCYGQQRETLVLAVGSQPHLLSGPYHNFHMPTLSRGRSTPTLSKCVIKSEYTVHS